MIASNFINKKVLVRAGSAGVHYGTLLERDGQEVRLQNAKRIWKWQGVNFDPLTKRIEQVTD